jgi:NTP pyrophosphatase (non-canonical NTP hydrolase)
MKEFIKNLSLNDKKTLSQKTLKLVEEIGELSRVILPYDSADGTNHRFIDKESILEELADIYLTNISILYSLGFSDEEFDDMIIKKSKKWSYLQSKENDVQFPLPYEIHITIDCSDISNYKKYFFDEFKKHCEINNLKPIVLDLELNDNTVIKDVMTSSKHFGDNRSVYEESQRIKLLLERLGYKVVRVKIETVPWHPKAPINNFEKMPEDCYFESHIGVLVKPNRKDDLNYIVNKKISNILTLYGGKIKLSQNYFKKTNDGSEYINMLTYRNDKVSGNVFEENVKMITDMLSEYNFKYEKVEIEFSIYDTNIKHDYE